MASSTPASVSTVRPARRARELLSTALGSLQSVALAADPRVIAIVSALAEASSALYRVEMEATSEELRLNLLVEATEFLSRALQLLQAQKGRDRAFDTPTETVGRAVAVLYPVAHATARRRRAVMLEGALTDEEAESLRGKSEHGARSPRKPATTPEPFFASDRRVGGDRRVHFEVDIALLSESNFYAGLSFDVSSGGVFVSTYRPAPPGSEVTLFFVLPSGHPVETLGVVRWIRPASADSPPGMGVAFTALKPEDLAAINAFCASRPPLYYESE